MNLGFCGAVGRMAGSFGVHVVRCLRGGVGGWVVGSVS